jgi:hypothetical protein
VNNLSILRSGLARILTPTLTQVLVALFLAIGGLLIAQTHEIFSRLGISDEAIQVTQQHVTSRFSVILKSALVGDIALVTFWAAVGLVAYLICWGLYNAVIEARNEVTIETQYTNKGHWQGVIETLALKAVAAVLTLVYVIVFQYGLALWLALASGLFTEFTMGNVLSAVLATLGMALQLYGLLVLIQLTLTPWYRAEAFTDQSK